MTLVLLSLRLGLLNIAVSLAQATNDRFAAAISAS
jgi:hypothetical protein